MATKIAVATSSIVHKIRYKAELSNQSLQDLAKVDAIFANTFLKTTNNMNSYPRRLIHLSRKRGELGMPLFSETVVIEKLQKLFGCMRSYKPHRLAAMGILSRLCRKHGIHAS